MAAHQSLRVLVNGDQAAVQPAAAEGDKISTLSISFTTGEIQQLDAPKLGSSAEHVLTVMGIMRFRAGTVLAVVTEAQKVATLYCQPVFKVTKTKLIKPAMKLDAGEKRLMSYLADAINPSGAGRNVFFSYNINLTLSAQKLADTLANPSTQALSPAAAADQQFLWNRVLAKPLVGAGAGAYCPAFIQGSVGQIAGVEAKAHGHGVVLDLALVARRSMDRTGTRHWRRGADFKGAVANFVETEQLVFLEGGRLLASYTQVRGSIPLVWTQIPNIKYKPPTKILVDGMARKAFETHMDSILAKYQAVTCIDLVNQHGSEGQLEKAFAKEGQRYASGRGAPLTYVAFDFHKECGATNYDRLSHLWNQLEPQFKNYGLYIPAPPPGAITTLPDAALPAPRRQGGVFRTNCVDCLDRTNVLQGVLGRKAVEEVLRQMGVLEAGETLAKSLPQVEAQFKVLWADHGDDISRQYAGTGALKSGFTRTGKRTLGGLIDDGIKSMARYYLNNFQDGHKQDALDLISGSYKLKPDVKVRFQRQHSPAIPITAALFALSWAVRGIHLLVRGKLTAGGSSSSSSNAALEAAGSSSGCSSQELLIALGQHVVGPLVVATVLFALVVKNGKWLVDRPQLCPQMANTVVYAASAEVSGATAEAKKAA